MSHFTLAFFAMLLSVFLSIGGEDRLPGVLTLVGCSIFVAIISKLNQKLKGDFHDN